MRRHHIPSPGFQATVLASTRKVRVAWALCVALACASTWATEPGTPPDVTAGNTRPDQRVEHITHEDGGSRVDELRVGGQTRQIDVQTKSGMPAYQISPAVGTQGASAPSGERSGSTGTAGRTSWRVLNF
jgi:hypothetical protein